MQTPIVAIALDAFSPYLLDRWLAEGKLPHLGRLRRQGTYGWLRNTENYLYENSWLTFLHGVSLTPDGQSALQSCRLQDYRTEELPAYRFTDVQPFYSLCTQLKTTVFDLPMASLASPFNGLQILGWGSDSNQNLCSSLPSEAMQAILQRYGQHALFAGPLARTLQQDDREAVLSYRIPSIYDLDALLDFKDTMLQGIRQRTAIISDLLEERPDLLLAAYSEMHMAGHLLWHLSLPYPAGTALRERLQGRDPLLEIAQTLDDSLGLLLARLPAEAHVVVFAVHGMQSNHMDVASSLFLPEFLFRRQWGQAALADGAYPTQLPAQVPEHYRRHWKDEIWSLRTKFGESMLESPAAQERRNDPLDWSPLNWYRQLWPRMQAFALPSYSHGLIRLNVKDRDRCGSIAADDFAQFCGDLRHDLLQLVNARNGRPVVRDVRLTRATPWQNLGEDTAADMIVYWDPEVISDAVESPGIGRIGPVPFFRSGGHAAHGFCLMQGPAISAGGALPADADAADLSATLMALAGTGIPAYMQGRCWL